MFCPTQLRGPDEKGMYAGLSTPSPPSSHLSGLKDRGSSQLWTELWMTPIGIPTRVPLGTKMWRNQLGIAIAR